MRPPTVTPVDSGSILASSTVQGASETGNTDTKVNDPHENIFILEKIHSGTLQLLSHAVVPFPLITLRQAAKK